MRIMLALPLVFLALVSVGPVACKSGGKQTTGGTSGAGGVTITGGSSGTGGSVSTGDAAVAPDATGDADARPALDATCALPDYPLGVPFILTSGQALPFPSSTTRYALVLTQPGTEGAADVTVNAAPTAAASPFPGALPAEPGCATPASLGSEKGGPYPARVPATVGAQASVVVNTPSGTGSVTVEVVYVNTAIVVAEDITTTNPKGRVSLADATSLADRIQSYTLVRDQLVLGPSCDVDGDGHLVVILSPTVAAVGAGAYFNSYDLLFSTFQSGGNYSNGGEYLYVTSPNLIAAGSSVDAWLSHELGHALHICSQFVRNGISGSHLNDTSVFVTEGVAHLAQDLAGMGDDQAIILQKLLERPSAFAVWDLFLAGRPAGSPSDDDGFAMRGGAYGFLRHLFDRCGGADYSTRGSVGDGGGIAFLRGYVAQKPLGIAGVEAAMGNSFDVLWRDFLLALALSGRVDESGQPVAQEARYRFRPRLPDSDTGQMQGFDPRGEINVWGTHTVLSGPKLEQLGAAVTLQAGQSSFFEVASGGACEARKVDVVQKVSSGTPGLDVFAVRLQ
jgi:hypothetical protein